MSANGEAWKKFAKAYGASQGKIAQLEEQKLKPILMMGKGGMVEIPAQVVTIHAIDPGGEDVMTVSVQDVLAGELAKKPKGFLQQIKDNKQAQVDAHGGYTVVYTDGGCQTSPPHIGAWAWTATRPLQKPITGTGVLGDTTNNRMELMAIYKALEELEIGPPIKVYSDSQYAISCATEWGPGWKKKGWITSDGKPVKNRDLIEPILMLVALHTVQFIHVKGHADSAGNNYVDSLCTGAIHSAYKKWSLDVSSIQMDGGLG